MASRRRVAQGTSRERRRPMILNEQWHRVYRKISLLVEGGKSNTISEAAQVLSINRKTLEGRLKEDLNVTSDNFSTFPEILDKAEREEGRIVEEIYEDKDGNNWTIDSLDRRVKTLEDLIRVCNIDLTVWRVERWVANKWEVGGFNRATRELGEEGWVRPHGTGVLITHPLFQVKAWLVRVEPIAVMPVIHPIVVSAKLPKPKKSAATSPKRAIAVYDMQVGFRRLLQTGELMPFHDRRVLDIVLQIMRYKHFDAAVFWGDELDLSEWSTHCATEPEFYFTTQAAIIELHWWLSQYRSAMPNAEMDMLDGNHNRFQDAIIANLRAAYQLRPADEFYRAAILTMSRMLALDDLHLNYIGAYDIGTARKWLADNLSLVHGDIARNSLGTTAGEMAKRNCATTIFGHIHRRETATKTMQFRDERAI